MKKLSKHLFKFLTKLIIVLLFCSSFIQQRTSSGKELFEKKCVLCHGANGTKHFLFAKDLQKSKIEDASIAIIIQNGKRFMPSYQNKFTGEEIRQLIEYVKTLRK